MSELEAFKPILTALVLPPVPWLALMLVGARWAGSGRRAGGPLVALGAVLVWLSACQGSGQWLQSTLLPAPPPLADAQLQALRQEAAVRPVRTAIVVLGGGHVARAPETGAADLKPRSIDRLRYGLWLARQTGLPLAASGGGGWARRGTDAPGEAEIARRIAERDFGQAVRWVEPEARDTRENAVYTLALLEREGISHLVLVTHAWHMPRALREFERAAAEGTRIGAAPMGDSTGTGRGVLAWLPSSEGFDQVRLVLRETLARWAEG